MFEASLQFLSGLIDMIPLYIALTLVFTFIGDLLWGGK